MLCNVYLWTNLINMITTLKPIVSVTELELIHICMGIDKPTFVNIWTKTKVRMNKTGNLYHDKVYKFTKGNYLLATDYEKRVIVEGGKEGLDMSTFKSEECTVGEHVSKCVLRNRNDNTKFYLQYEVFKETKLQVDYEYNGNSIDRALFQSFEIKKSQSKKQPQKRKVTKPSFSFSSILEMTINGTRYVKI